MSGRPLSSVSRDLRAYIVFQGGGAKGIVHVGALRAVEESRIDILGAAGTSAGAIMAALVAAGYGSDDIVARDGSRTILADFGFRSATQLLGDGGWTRVRVVRLLNDYDWTVLAVVLTFLVPLLIGVGHTVSPWGTPAVVLGVLAVLGVIAGGVGWAFHWALGGLCTTHAVTAALDKALAARVPPTHPDGRVRFRDMPRPLKVVATCLGTQEMVLFSNDKTPDVAVADAVAASIAIPLIFVPKDIDRTLHFDGGLVSNLPVWPFDEERALDPRALTIAIEIVERVPNGRAADAPAAGVVAVEPSPFGNLVGAIRAAVFGGNLLNKRAADRLHALPMATEIGVLQFDLTLEQAMTAIRDARKAAQDLIRGDLFETPALFRQACANVQAAFLYDIANTLNARAETLPHDPVVRVSLAEIEPERYHSLRLRYSCGMDGYLDEELLLPIVGSLAGAAYREKRPHLDTHPFQPEYDLSGTPDPKRRKLIWDKVQWRLAIPIFDPRGGTGKVRMVLCIDSNVPLEYCKAANDGRAIAAVSGIISEALERLTPEGAEAGRSP